MSGLRFEIGAVAWWSTFSTVNDYVVCPDCGGTGRIRVIFHDDTQVSIECGNCRVGYDPPTGRVRVYERVPQAACVVIQGFEVGTDGTRWRTDKSYIVDDADVFEDQQSALDHAKARVAILDKEERDRIFNKEKDTRTWAWNASYHRKQIKEANRQIAYHTAKLNVAALKAKEPA